MALRNSGPNPRKDITLRTSEEKLIPLGYILAGFGIVVSIWCILDFWYFFGAFWYPGIFLVLFGTLVSSWYFLVSLQGLRLSQNNDETRFVDNFYDEFEEIYEKLDEVFRNDVESFVRVQFYLDQEKKTCLGTGTPPSLGTLKRFIDHDTKFKSYAKRLSDSTKTVEENSKFEEAMELLSDMFLNDSEQIVNNNGSQNRALGILANGAACVWAVNHREWISSFIRTLTDNKSVIIDSAVGLIDKCECKISMGALAAVSLSHNVIVNIRRWWKGEITGARCMKNIVDSGVCIGTGACGGMVGSAIGNAVAGLCGNVIGEIVVGIVAAQTANFLVGCLTQWIFGLPKEKALENAYKYFGVSMRSSNQEINTAYRHLCLKHHPDKGGNRNDFLFVQYNMAIIKAARGEL